MGCGFSWLEEEFDWDTIRVHLGYNTGLFGGKLRFVKEVKKVYLGWKRALFVRQIGLFKYRFV